MDQTRNICYSSLALLVDVGWYSRWLYALLFITISSTCIGKPSITCTFNTGRTGDRILTILKCLKIAQKYKLEFITPCFEYSEYFFGQKGTKPFNGIRINNENAVKGHLDGNALLITNYSFKMNDTIWNALKDPDYRELIQGIFFKEPEQRINIPTGYFGVALHIRKGSHDDLPLYADQGITKTRSRKFADKCWPLKFPPNQYYVDQINYLIQTFPDEKLFIYIFTDHKEPTHLKEIIEDVFKNHTNITVACREPSISYQKEVINDLLNMARFPCLIRSESNYSKIAHIIGNNELVIYPTSHTWENNKLIINQVKVMNSYA